MVDLIQLDLYDNRLKSSRIGLEKLTNLTYLFLLHYWVLFFFPKSLLQTFSFR